MTTGTIAVVAIGRNEGERLKRCLQSVRGVADPVVYVDSGSTDGSVEYALSMGVEVVSLDTSVKFTAARARNAGFRRAIEVAPESDFVQFVDGDCEVVEGWIEEAATFLDANSGVAAVTGRRRERFPERSVYNRLCDQEWNRPAGQALQFGGDVMIRSSALREVGGYRDSLIAGEEPELCVRLRCAGWRIHVLPAEMTRHDAAMVRFRQWWSRTRRSGYAYAEGAWLHGRSPERHWVWESLRSWCWALGPPLAGGTGAFLTDPWALLVLLLYPLQVARLYLRESGDRRDRLAAATFNVLARFPEFAGQLRFLMDLVLRREGRLIEYK